MKKIGLSLLVAGLLAACGSTQTPEPTAAPVATPAPTAAPAATPAPVATGPEVVIEAPTTAVAATAGEYNQLTDPNNILSQREIYFDFDKSVVKEESTEVIEAHSNYLTLTNGAKTSLQGHADERGTAEYNIGLGNRRANAVKKVMTTAYGVEDKQVEVISYGKERPAVQGHSEEAWAKNRRVEIVYPGEAKFPKK